MDAVKELKWFVAGIILLGIIWIAAGGLSSVTKSNPFIKPAAPLSTGQTYNSGNFLTNFLFPWANMSTSGSSFGNAGSGSLPISAGSLPISPNTQLSAFNQSVGSRKTYYGADEAPGPALQVPDTLNIDAVQLSNSEEIGPGDEYVQISAPETNQKPYLLTGMVLESRMTGNQEDIRKGVAVYYANNINSQEPVWLKPGDIAYIISRRSPLGYSFKSNKCIGYLSNNAQNYVIGLPGGCPGILDYPLPARPNAFSDNCLDFLHRIGSCQSQIGYPNNIEAACRNFVSERTNYTRCVADFGNDPNFLGNEWRIYLNRDEPLWKGRREIVDLIDQKGNLIDSYIY